MTRFSHSLFNAFSVSKNFSFYWGKSVANVGILWVNFSPRRVTVAQKLDPALLKVKKSGTSFVSYLASLLLQFFLIIILLVFLQRITTHFVQKTSRRQNLTLCVTIFPISPLSAKKNGLFFQQLYSFKV